MQGERNVVRLRFDNGTLLLEDPPRHAAPSTLPGVLWDPRVEAYRAPARYYGMLRASLEQRGVRFTPSWRSKVPARPTGPWNPPSLRPYQAAAVDAWGRANRQGVVSLPTGSGKTRVALAAMATTGLPTLCLVPTRVLLHQWLAALEVSYGGAVGVLGDGRRSLGPVTVATFESGWRHMARIGDRFGMLVVDETHHFGRGWRDEALEMAVAPARLGLTATPSDDDVALARLEELLGPVVYHCSVDELAGRWLASYEHITLEVELTRAERRAYARDMAAFRAMYVPFRRTFAGSSWADFARAAHKSDTGRRALAGWRRARKRLAYPESKAAVLRGLLARHADSRALVFTEDNATAYAIARDHLVMPLTCDIGKAERDEVLARFREGQLRVLVSSRVLNEGLDVPDADVAVVVGGALGAREHLQRVGRLLRPAEGKRAVIYELVVRRTGEVARARRRREGLAATRQDPHRAEGPAARSALSR